MNNEFYQKYQVYSKEQIFDILKNKDSYQPASVSAAEQILIEKKWKLELSEIMEHEEEVYEKEVAERAEHYKNAVEFKNDQNTFSIKTSEVPKFESSLYEFGIEFYREDKHVGVQLDSFPTETYYFKNKDVDAVDKICIDLKLVTTPYADIKPFFKFELKAIIIVVVIFVILLLAIL